MNTKALKQSRKQVCCVTHCLLNCPAVSGTDVAEMLFAYMNNNGLLTDGGTDSELIEAFVAECDNEHTSRSVHRIGHYFDDVFFPGIHMELDEFIPDENIEN